MTLHLVQGDITQFTGDAIVNAANASLMGGGGVDGAIHRAAGRELLEECRTLGGCEVGNAKITKGYNLPATYVIHAVGPVWWGGQRGEAALLASAYRRSLELAEAHGITHIAFPAISCGAYNYPIELATPIAVATVQAFLAHHPLPREVTFYAFDGVVYQAYQKALAEAED